MNCRRASAIARSAAMVLIVMVGVLAFTRGSEAGGDLSVVKVCIDPGHGGIDPGAVNEVFDTLLFEKDINLDVSFGLKSLFEGEGAEVVMTRTGDEYRTNTDRYTYCNDQNATLLISVHTNSVADSTVDGAMVLYGPRESPELAQHIYDVMYPYLQDLAPVSAAEFIDYGVSRFASGVLFKSDMPAAMVEPVFMSHPAEAELLTTPIFSAGEPNTPCPDYSCRRGQIAEAVFQGVLSYIGGQSGGAMHVNAVQMSYERKQSNYFINTAVTIHDSELLPVEEATVVIRTEYPDGAAVISESLTNSEGVANFRFRTRSQGAYSVEILDVSKGDWLYDSGINVEDSDQIEIP